jgi:hypothetical protein
MMADHEHLSPAQAGPAVIRSCWLCGIRLPADHMMADGGRACADIRWYCLDRRGCTERWTSRTADARHGGAGMPEPPSAVSHTSVGR